MAKRNPGLKYWTADQCAECLDISQSLGHKLWSFLDEAINPTPMGGDGSDGTIEEPSGQLDEDNDDKAMNFWHKLTPEEQEELNNAYVKYNTQIDEKLDAKDRDPLEF